jgi:hypothetical protein
MPPITFDRTPEGEIIVPGRWWQHVFERSSESPDMPDELREVARKLAQHAKVSDAHVPASVETISFLAPDRNGNLVVHEALPPEGRIDISLVSR